MIERIGKTERMSEAAVVGSLVFLAGHVAENTRGQSVKAQTAEILQNLDRTLAKAGTTKECLVSVTVYLADISGYAQLNEAWDAWVAKDNAPPRATIEARLAFPDLLVEITAVAAK